jgi:hypothetical protein
MWPVLTLCVVFAIAITGLVYLPNTPLPNAWNPIKPLGARDEITFLTGRKLTRATQDFMSCQAALNDMGVRYTVLPDREVSDSCHIRNQVQVRQLSTAQLTPLKTTCGTALRLAMWEYHFVQPIAEQELGSQVIRIDQLGSYSCRQIRNANGATNRMSQHATANAVDVSGFQLPTGKRISVLKNWNDTPENERFMQAVRDGGCQIYNITLSPEYNALHADHFHFDQGEWMTCR